MNDKKKMGRPIKGDEAKTEQYRIRLTKTEMEMLEYCSNVKKITKADVLRDGLYKTYSELKDK